MSVLKKNFIVLLVNFFIEGSFSGHVNKKFALFSGNVDKCFKYNWCRYLIVALQTSVEKWYKDPKPTFFCGSMAFLMVRYTYHFLMLQENDCINIFDIIFLFFQEHFSDIKEDDSVHLFPSYVKWNNIILSDGISQVFWAKVRRPIEDAGFSTQHSARCDLLLFLFDYALIVYPIIYILKWIFIQEHVDDVVAEKIIKKVCKDIEMEFENDEDGTPEVLRISIFILKLNITIINLLFYVFLEFADMF